MAIDFDTFKTWAQEKFNKIDVKGTEIKINSIFADNDEKFHLWCSPSGGKNQRPYGVFHCWKSGRKGSLISLVMEVEKCNRDSAMELLGLKEYKGKPIEEISLGNEEYENIDLDEIKFKNITLPPNTYEVNKAPISWYEKSKTYLEGRGLKTDNFYVCTSGKFWNRIIIPYYDKKGGLIYFNGRTLGDDELRYKGPEKEIGVGKEDVLFFTNFPEQGEKIYLCEGEFDACTLNLVGLNAVACGGKNLSEKQAIMLSNYKICLALDYDNAGKQALNKMYNTLISFGFMDINERVSLSLPPEAYKDWNKFYTVHGSKMLLEYIRITEKIFDTEYSYDYI